MHKCAGHFYFLMILDKTDLTLIDGNHNRIKIHIATIIY